MLLPIIDSVGGNTGNQTIALFVIVLAAAEAAVALAIFLHLYNTHGTANVDDADDLKG